MSMEIFTLSDHRLTSLEDWQKSIDIMGVSLVLSTETSVGELRGFLPVRSGGVATGFECDRCQADEVMRLYGAVDFGRNWRCALAFNWRGFDEGLAAYSAAAAYAKAADGVVFDPQDGVVLSPQQAFNVAVKMKAEMPKVKEFLRTMSSSKAATKPK
jgi:hypothetical protein